MYSKRTAAWVIPRDERKYSQLSKSLFKASNIYRQIHQNCFVLDQ